MFTSISLRNASLAAILTTSLYKPQTRCDARVLLNSVGNSESRRKSHICHEMCYVQPLICYGIVLPETSVVVMRHSITLFQVIRMQSSSSRVIQRPHNNFHCYPHKCKCLSHLTASLRHCDNHIIAAFRIGDKDFHTLVEKQKYKSQGMSVLKCVLFM